MSDTSPKKKQKIYRKLKNKFRLVVMNDDSFEVSFSMVLSALNVFTWGGLVLIGVITLVVLSIAFTPLRELIPGYADIHTRRIASYAALKADSLSYELELKNQYIANIKILLQGDAPKQLVNVTTTDSKVKLDKINYKPSKEDSLMRERIESEDQYNLTFVENSELEEVLSQLFFFAPITGIVSDSFNLSIKHYGVDIIAPKNEVIKATLDGTVVLASWTQETGHVIQLQHNNNLISVYKHNSVLLKEMGDKVKAGEAIAIIGDSGELTSGPHLHFELWQNGLPIDPQKIILF